MATLPPGQSENLAGGKIEWLPSWVKLLKAGYFFINPIANEEEMIGQEHARRAMVASQLQTNRIYDERVIAAFANVPREMFFPRHLKEVAYCDLDIEYAPGKFLIEPMILAKMFQVLAVTRAEKIMIIGDVPGYAAAIASYLTQYVILVVSDPCDVNDLADAMTHRLLSDVTIHPGPLQDGFALRGPFDKILVVGSCERVPSTWFDQLKEGGKMIAPVREDAVDKVTLFAKKNGKIVKQLLFEAWLPSLPSLMKKREFNFA